MKKVPLLLLACALAGFAFGLVRLFQLRFEAGDNYPEYSSLRADPLGSKVLFESYGSLLSARRHFRDLGRLGEGTDTTALFLGVPGASLQFPPAELKGLETFVRSGGRLVFALFPSYGAWRPAPPPPRGLGLRAPGVTNQTAAERWGIKLEHEPLDRDTKGVYAPATAWRKNDEPLPEQLLVHTAVTFAGLDPAWRTIYARRVSTNDLAVLIERPLGRGTLVLAADSFPFSNEALRRERQSALLAWIVGPNHRVLFDEAHLGVHEKPGIASLARQYRLSGLFLALLVLAGLFIWKSAVGFIPPHQELLARERAEEVEGRDSASGFINLLRRNLPPGDLMKICLTEWNSHVARDRKPAPHRLLAMQQLIDAENALPPPQRNPVRLYREFCRILSKTTASNPNPPS